MPAYYEQLQSQLVGSVFERIRFFLRSEKHTKACMKRLICVIEAREVCHDRAKLQRTLLGMQRHDHMLYYVKKGNPSVFLILLKGICLMNGHVQIHDDFNCNSFY